MNDFKVFISYAHSNKTHKEKVIKFREKLTKEGINAILDIDISKDEANRKSWPVIMKERISKAEKVLIIASKKYFDAYEHNLESEKNDQYGSFYEAQIIRNDIYHHHGENNKYYLVVIDEEQKEFIPSDFKSRNPYYVYEDKKLDELVANLPKVKEHEKILNRSILLPNSYSKEYTRFINRETNREELSRLISVNNKTNIFSKKGRIIQIYGSPKIGKKAFVTKTLKDLTNKQATDSKDNEFFFYNDGVYKENSLGQLLQEAFLIENIGTDYLKEKQVFNISKEIDKKRNHCIFIYKDFDKNLQKSEKDQNTEKDIFEELFKRHEKILNKLTEIGLSPEKSDFSIIVTCRKEIDDPISNFNNSINRKSIKIKLEEIKEDDVKQALVSLLDKSLKNESGRFDIVIDNFWKITRGLPGAIHQLLVDIENNEDLIYDLHQLDLSNYELPEIVETFYKQLVDEHLITPECFTEDDNGLTRKQKEKLISEICTYRTINNRIFKKCITHINRELKTTQINTKNMRELLENVCFIKSNLYDFEIYSSIRNILFQYYKKSRKEKINSHQKAKAHFFELWIEKIESMKDEDDLHRELFLIQEAIWHETNIAIYSFKTKKRLFDSIRELIEKSYQANPDFKETIYSELNFLYRRSKEGKHDELRNEFKVHFDSDSEDFKTFPIQVIS